MEQPFNPRARTIQCPTDLIVGTKYVIFRLFFGQNLISYYAFRATAPKTIRFRTLLLEDHMEGGDSNKSEHGKTSSPYPRGPPGPDPPAGGSGPGVPL